MPECPYCGKWFRTKRGLKQHITKSHTFEFAGGRVFDVTTVDIFGAMERREERKRGRKKRSFLDLW